MLWLKCTNDKNAIRTRKKHNFTKDVAAAGGIWCYLWRGGERIWSYVTGYSIATFPSVIWHCWLATGRTSGLYKAACWFVGDDLTGALHVLQLQLSSPLPSSLAPIKSRMETFMVLANPGSPGKWQLEERERERERERDECSVSGDHPTRLDQIRRVSRSIDVCPSLTHTQSATWT